MNQNENNEINEKKKGKSTAIKDIIEKLKAKKIEKEELGKKEKEAEEESMMRRKIKKKEKSEKIKNEENRNNELKNTEKEEEKKEEEVNKLVVNENNNLGKKEENTKKLKKERSKEKNKRYKRSIDIIQENLLLPHKTFRDEKDEEEMNYFVKKTNNINYKNSKEKNLRRKQLELDINSEINKDNKNNNSIKIASDKYNRRQRLNSNDLIPRPLPINKCIKDSIKNAYIKPINKISTNNRVLNVYKPKKPGAGAKVRGRSLEKAGPPNLLLNKINNEAFNNSSNNIFSTITNNTIFNNNK